MSNPGFFAWETATLELALVDENGEPAHGFLDDAETCTVTIRQGPSCRIDKTGAEVVLDKDTPALTVRLSQGETKQFAGGTKAAPKHADVQVNIFRAGERDVTFETSIEVWRNLYPWEMKR